MEVNKEKENEKMGSELVPDWSNMTWDGLFNIFSRLSIEQRWLAPMLACKTWLNVCKDSSLNSVFDLEAWFQSSTESSFWWSSEFADKVDSFLISVVQRSEGSLTEIRVRHCTDRALLYVADRCPNLEVLWVKQCPKVTDKSMTSIALKCHKIKELDISHSYGISSESMHMVGRMCKNLKIIKRNFGNPSEFSRFESYEYYMKYLFNCGQYASAEALGTSIQHN